MAHPGHEVPQAGSRPRGQGIAGVTQVVEVQLGRSDAGDRLPPIDKLVEVPPPDRRAAGRGEDKGIGLIEHIRIHVCTDLRKDHGRNRYDPFPGA